MFKINRIITILVCLASVGMCFAQGGGGGRQGRRGGGGPPTIGRLIFQEDVQADLQLTDDEKTKLQALRESFRGNRGGGGTATRPTPEEMRQRSEDQQKQVEAILSPDQVTRLHQILIQLQGEEAATHPEVQSQLGLSEDQKSKIAALLSAYQAANASVRQKQQSNEIDRQTGRADMQKNSATLKEGINGILTDAQKAKLKDLGGKPFVRATPPTGA